MLRSQYSKEDLAALTIRHSLNLEENETETPKAKHSRKGFAVRPEREARGEKVSDKLARLYADAPQADERVEKAKRQAMLEKQRKEREEIRSQLLSEKNCIRQANPDRIVCSNTLHVPIALTLESPFEDIRSECERIAKNAEPIKKAKAWWRLW